MLRRVGRLAKEVDDKVQTFARDVYGANDPKFSDTGTLRGKIAAFGGFMHPRFGYQDKVGDVGVAMSRAAQIGGLTAAGYGLMKLTEKLTEQFGGAADQQERGQLRISDLPEVHQELIKGRPGEVIAAGMQGVGVMAGIPQKDLEMMQTAVANEEFYR